MVDTELSTDILVRIEHPQRRIIRCDRPHRNWGHTCRHNAYSLVKGDYIYHLDDDNVFADDNVLRDMKCVTSDWALFPIDHADPQFGKHFFNDPPGIMKADTGSILVKRGIARWPDLDRYDCDGVFIEQLVKQFPNYQVFPDMRSIMVMGASGSVLVEVKSGNRVSIYTASHSNAYLRDTYDSIKDQDFHEWIIAYNNGGVPTNFGDSRVKPMVLYKSPERVGALKSYACEQCTGDILLELDHDDLLMPTAIAEVQHAFEDEAIGFVYSNSLHVTESLDPMPRYDESFGWRYREVTFRGKKLDEFVSFPPTPESVSRIWYGPDHLRAFRRSIYQQIGGYDQSMTILDDSDLCCRMYLATKMLHIDKPLYVYRVHGQNSWLRFNDDIQRGVYSVYDKYIERIVDRWAEMNSKFQFPKLEIGCKSSARDGYIATWTIDDFPESSASVIRATDSLAMLPNPMQTMKEISRVLRPGGWLMCQVPSTDGRGAYQDPRHITFWNENSFLYYINRNWAQYIDTPARFQATRLYTTEPNANRVCWTVAHLINLKDNYRPCGLIDI
jgi:glycosyltransferase involved in cell wall biosynthesis